MAEYKTQDITVGDVQITIETSGPEGQAEKVHMHTHDEAVKAAQVFESGNPPEENDGLPLGVNWNSLLSEDE